MFELGRATEILKPYSTGGLRDVAPRTRRRSTGLVAENLHDCPLRRATNLPVCRAQNDFGGEGRSVRAVSPLPGRAAHIGKEHGENRPPDPAPARPNAPASGGL